MRERVLITGASGLLGASLGIGLLNSGCELLGVRRNNPRVLPFPEVILDLRRFDRVSQLVDEYRPTTIVHAAALSKVMACESSPEEAFAQNVAVTRCLTEAAQKIGVYVIFISTDQVFNGREALRSETDSPVPTHIYGKTKREAEKIVADGSESNLILRSNNVVGRNSGWGRSFTDGVLDSLKHSLDVQLFDDQFRSPVHLSVLVSIIRACITNRVPGILHAGGPERLSRYETGVMLADAYNFSRSLVIPVSMSTHPHAATMHSDGSFCTEKLCTFFPELGRAKIYDGFLHDAKLDQQ